MINIYHAADARFKKSKESEKVAFIQGAKWFEEQVTINKEICLKLQNKNAELENKISRLRKKLIKINDISNDEIIKCISEDF